MEDQAIFDVGNVKETKILGRLFRTVHNGPICNCLVTVSSQKLRRTYRTKSKFEQGRIVYVRCSSCWKDYISSQYSIQLGIADLKVRIVTLRVDRKTMGKSLL